MKELNRGVGECPFPCIERLNIRDVLSLHMFRSDRMPFAGPPAPKPCWPKDLPCAAEVPGRSKAEVIHTSAGRKRVKKGRFWKGMIDIDCPF
eukprot:4778889-Amphidinium_carterae.1